MKLKCQYTSSWDISKSAGVDLASGFHIRNNKFTETRKFQRISFNKTPVYELYGNLEDLLKTCFTPDHIVNFDEVILSTILKTKTDSKVFLTIRRTKDTLSDSNFYSFEDDICDNYMMMHSTKKSIRHYVGQIIL